MCRSIPSFITWCDLEDQVAIKFNFYIDLVLHLSKFHCIIKHSIVTFLSNVLLYLLTTNSITDIQYSLTNLFKRFRLKESKENFT